MSWAGIAVLVGVPVLIAVGLLWPRRRDPVFAALAIVALIAFVGVIGWFVGHPDLIIVLAIGCGLAAYDFWNTARSDNGRSDNGRNDREP